MSYDRKSEKWVAERRALLAAVRDANQGTLEGASWPIKALVRARGGQNQRLLFKLQKMYKAYRAAGDDEAAATKKLEEMHYRQPPADYLYLSKLVRDGRVLLAWVKYMALRGRPASQTVLLLRQALACHILAGPGADERRLRDVVEQHLGKREDRADVTDLLVPASPFAAAVPPAANGKGFDELVGITFSVSEQDVDDMRHTYLPVVREGDPPPQRRPKSVRSRFAGEADLYVAFGDADFQALSSMPMLESLPRALRYKCVLATPISYKNRTVQYAEVERASPQFRQKLETFVDRLRNIPPRSLVFVDETSMFKDAFLSKGWGPVGGPALVTVPKSAGARTAVWSAVSLERTYAQILPPTSRSVAEKYRAIRTPALVRAFTALRANPSYGLPINQYLLATEGGRKLRTADTLMELCHLAAEGRGGAYKLLGADFARIPEYGPRIQALVQGLRGRLENEEKRTPGQFAVPAADLIVAVAHADFILRERCSLHNRFEPAAGRSVLFGSGRLGLWGGRFDPAAYEKDLQKPVFSSSEGEADLPEEEEEELVVSDEGPEERALTALSRIAKRLYYEARGDGVAFARTLQGIFRDADASNGYKGNSLGDVYKEQALVGRDAPEFAVPFGDAKVEVLGKLIETLASDLGVDWRREVADRSFLTVPGQKLATMHMLATGDYRAASHFLASNPDILSRAELEDRFPFLRDPALGRAAVRRGDGGPRRYLMPPFDVRDRREKRANVMDAESQSVSSNQHLFREFLRSLPPELVRGRTVVMDNASFHGGLRRDEIQAIQELCTGNGICYAGRDLRAELSEEARELREAGAGVGVPLVLDRSNAAERNRVDPPAEKIRRALAVTQPALLFLPPYCPQLNPIETVFALVKQAARRALDRAPQRTRFAVSVALRRGFDRVGADVLEAEYIHSGYLSRGLDGAVTASVIDPREFLSRAGILGYIKRLLEANLGRVRVDRERYQGREAADPAAAATETRKIKTYVEKVVKAQGMSVAGRRILSRAFGIRGTGNLDRKLIADPVGAAPVQAARRPPAPRLRRERPQELGRRGQEEPQVAGRRGQRDRRETGKWWAGVTAPAAWIRASLTGNGITKFARRLSDDEVVDYYRTKMNYGGTDKEVLARARAAVTGS